MASCLLTESARKPGAKLLLWSAVAAGLALSAITAWRLQASVELAAGSRPLQQPLAKPAQRLLLVGDSTAVGTGASGPQASVAGLLAQQFPGLQIDNRGRDGAQWAELLAQLDGEERFDMVLVMAGGNDVVRLRGLEALRNDVERVTQRARERAEMVVLMPAGNVGNAPLFFPPLSWLMTWRSRQLHHTASEVASRHGALFVNLFRETADDPFVQRPELNAQDGLHPSDAGYRLWFDELMVQANLPQHLSAAHATVR